LALARRQRAHQQVGIQLLPTTSFGSSSAIDVREATPTVLTRITVGRYVTAGFEMGLKARFAVANQAAINCVAVRKILGTIVASEDIGWIIGANAHMLGKLAAATVQKLTILVVAIGRIE